MTAPLPSSAIEATVLDESVWRARQAAHEARVRVWTEPHQTRQARGEKHPVEDFLFTYYPFRPAWLRRWHPGPDTILRGAGAREFLRWPEYMERDGGVTVDPARWPEARREFLGWLADLLRITSTRPPHLGCFGLHEWAMVYGLTQEAVRHAGCPLRLPPAEIARVVESQNVCCTHFDAFRFFTPAARPLNRWQPTRERTPELEQRGCLHTNMDLYKWATKLVPFTSGELLADCFALARDIRVVDMRASPYDVSAWGHEPITIETEAGRAAYLALQRGFAERSQPLRAQLLALVERLLTASVTQAR